MSPATVTGDGGSRQRHGLAQNLRPRRSCREPRGERRDACIPGPGGVAGELFGRCGAPGSPAGDCVDAIGSRGCDDGAGAQGAQLSCGCRHILAAGHRGEFGGVGLDHVRGGAEGFQQSGTAGVQDGGGTRRCGRPDEGGVRVGRQPWGQAAGEHDDGDAAQQRREVGREGLPLGGAHRWAGLVEHGGVAVVPGDDGQSPPCVARRWGRVRRAVPRCAVRLAEQCRSGHPRVR